MIRRVLLILMLFWSTFAVAQSRILPVDEAASIPDFFSFRAQLLTAIAKRDAAGVLAALNKDVRLSFGDDYGLEGFKKIWKPDSADSLLWEVMAGTLALGGTFGSDGGFTAPYVFTRWPEDRDPFEYLVAIGSDIRVRSAPDKNSGVVGSLHFSVVKRAHSSSADSKWMKVNLDSGAVGFVDARFIRSPVDHRITFMKLDGRWQITAFVAGD
jgi:hypothetical protein